MGHPKTIPYARAGNKGDSGQPDTWPLYEVFMNGERIDDVIEASVDPPFIVRFVRNKKGHIVDCPFTEKPKTETLCGYRCGTVEIRLKEEEDNDPESYLYGAIY